MVFHRIPIQEGSLIVRYRLILSLSPTDPPFPSYRPACPAPGRLALPSHPLFPSLTPSTDGPPVGGTDNDDAYSETASEVSYGRWDVASGPEWLETLDEHEAYLRGLGGEYGRPVPAPEGAHWMLGDLMRERADAEMKASRERDESGDGGAGRAEGNGHDRGGLKHENGGERVELAGDRPDTPALKKPDLPPRPMHGHGQGHLYDGMYL